MYTIVGIEKREGTYEGRDYSNVILHTTYEKENNDTCKGICVSVLKIKSIHCPVVEIGSKVDPLYDKYGNIVHLSVE